MIVERKTASPSLLLGAQNTGSFGSPGAATVCHLAVSELGEEADALCILYLRIVEQGGGFEWRVHLHEASDPMSAGEDLYQTDLEAREAGRVALNKTCAQFERYERHVTSRAQIASLPHSGRLRQRVIPSSSDATKQRGDR